MCNHIPFRVSRELVAKDGNTVDGTTCLEMLLNLFRRGGVVDLYASE